MSISTSGRIHHNLKYGYMATLKRSKNGFQSHNNKQTEEIIQVEYSYKY